MHNTHYLVLCQIWRFVLISQIDRFLVFMSMNEIPNKKQEILINQFYKNDESFSLDELLFNEDLSSIFLEDELKTLRKNYDGQQLDGTIENMLNSGIKILTVFSEDFPKSLYGLSDRPLILYAKGDVSLLKGKCFSVVGTRMPTSYGKIITEKFVKKLVQGGLTIVSGLCFGIDEIAHRTTLEMSGKTIAIIGSGFSHIYPSTNVNLAKQIAEKGLILSEYPPSFLAKKYTFPRRNRIIAGVSMGILIPEAGIKSGTMHTKEYALEYGKDIFAVPGNVVSNKSELPNMLIKTAQAECVLSADDILEFYGLNCQKRPEQNKYIELSFDEQMIINLLKNEERSFDFLAKETKIPVNILNSCLTTLEIRGLIKKLPAQKFCLT